MEWKFWPREPTAKDETTFHTGDFVSRLAVVTVCGLVASISAATLVAASAGQAADGLRWGLYLVASMSIAAIVGLIFGVPRARADFTATVTERYSSNSNLEQISDWLTKLLVGAGLVQLGSLPGLTTSVGTYLGAGMAVSNPAAYSVSALVLGAGMGFAVGYLWTRIRFRYLLEAAENSAAKASTEKKASLALGLANQGDETPATEAEVRRAVSKAVTASRSLTGEVPAKRILWVDDRPSNNASLREALRQVNVPVDLSLSTADAIERLHKGQYCLVITDMGRRETPSDGGQPTFVADAGLELIHQIRDFNSGIPIYVYAGRPAMQRRDELKKEGATEVFDKATELFSAASEVALGI